MKTKTKPTDKVSATYRIPFGIHQKIRAQANRENVRYSVVVERVLSDWLSGRLVTTENRPSLD